MRLAPLPVLLLILACGRPVATPPMAAPGGAPAAEVTAAEAVVQRQLEAYNRGDLEAFLATYAPGTRIHEHPDRLQLSGIEQLRERYGRLFQENPELRATVDERIVRGDYVIDHETVTGISGGPTIRAVAIYEVRDGLIRNVWFIR